jgi:hypothetical protein
LLKTCFLLFAFDLYFSPLKLCLSGLGEFDFQYSLFEFRFSLALLSYLKSAFQKIKPQSPYQIERTVINPSFAEG